MLFKHCLDDCHKCKKNSQATESKRSWIMFERDAPVQDDMASRNSKLYKSSIVDVMKLSVALEGVL